MFIDGNLDAVGQTVQQLRDVRRAVTRPGRRPLKDVIKPSTRYGFSGRERQVFLAEAGILGADMGNYFAAIASDNGQAKILREKWLDTLGQFNGRFNNLSPLSSSNGSNVEQMSYWILDHVLNVGAEPNYVAWELLAHNNMGEAAGIDEALGREVGIVAPLSTDFLIAAVFCGYLDQTHGKTFQLAPIAIAVDEGGTVLSIFTAHMKEVAIYIDGVGEGQTARAAYGMVKEIFSDRPIHKPVNKRMEDIIPTFKFKVLSRPRGMMQGR